MFGKFVLVFLFVVCAIVGGHIVIYNTDGDHTDEDHTSPQLDFETQMSDVRAELVNITSQISALIERVNSLEPEKEKATATATATTPKTTTTMITTSSTWADFSITYKSSCYYIDSTDVNFTTAENICSQQQAHLVHLETQEENEFLKGVMSKFYNESLLYWIGMTDSVTEGVWKMTGTNTTIPFTDWQGTEPENAVGRTHPTGQDCAAFFRRISYSWADINCFDRLARAVCEKKM